MAETPEISDERIAEIEAGCEGVTPGPWMVQDSNSWRRIGRRYEGQDGGVLCPIKQNDGHPDLCAGRGQDTYKNLRHIANCDPDTIRAMAKEIRESRARLRRTEAELAKAREVLADIAKQKLENEIDWMETEDPDWQGGYEECVRRARAFLKEKPNG